MNYKIANLYICPMCHGPLILNKKELQGQNVITGSFFCDKCKTTYPIQEGIPIFWKADLKIESFPLNKEKNIWSKRPEDIQERVSIANQIQHDRIASTYDDNPYNLQFLTQNSASQERIHEVINFISENTNRQLFLDIGCGTGNILKIGNQVFDISIGLDISFEMLRIASKRGLEVCQATAQYLPIRTATIDVISCFSVLHHIYNLDTVFHEFSRVLITNGYLYTDWDPSHKAREMDKLLADSKMYNAFIFPYRIVRKALRRLLGKQMHKHSELPDSIEKLAEYYDCYGHGLDPLEVKILLSVVGFQTQIYYHNDAPSILNKNELSLLARLKLGIKFWFAYNNLKKVDTALPIFATISRKIG